MPKSPPNRRRPEPDAPTVEFIVGIWLPFLRKLTEMKRPLEPAADDTQARGLGPFQTRLAERLALDHQATAGQKPVVAVAVNVPVYLDVDRAKLQPPDSGPGDD
jgi:hypothetical protein